MTGTALQKTGASKRRLTKYDPEKGVKTIRVLDAVQKHWEKARDAEQLGKVIHAKATEQSEFVFWWDTQANKNPGAKGQRLPNRERGRKKSTTPFDRLSDYGIDKFMVGEWRKKYGDKDQFDANVAIEIEHARARIECERREQRVSKNTGEFEWYTPAEIVEAARRVMGAIDLDPATTEAANVVVKAAQIFTATDDALSQRWDGRVWMNPPYSQPLVAQFCDKLAASVEAGTVVQAVVLVNNATETGWFVRLARVAAAACFPEGRIQFWHPKKKAATPLQGQAILYLGREVNVSLFRGEFEVFGVVWVKP